MSLSRLLILPHLEILQIHLEARGKKNISELVPVSFLHLPVIMFLYKVIMNILVGTQIGFLNDTMLKEK